MNEELDTCNICNRQRKLSDKICNWCFEELNSFSKEKEITPSEIKSDKIRLVIYLFCCLIIFPAMMYDSWIVVAMSFLVAIFVGKSFKKDE